MITPARHVYQAGSRVGAESDGSATKRQLRTASSSTADPTITHHDVKRSDGVVSADGRAGEAAASVRRVSVNDPPSPRRRRLGEAKDRGRSEAPRTAVLGRAETSDRVDQSS